LVHSMAASPDKKNSSVISAMRAGASYQQAVQVAKSTYTVTKTVEESAARTVFVRLKWGGPMACPVPSRSERSAFGGNLCLKVPEVRCPNPS
jgi:hypothetical protein